jgi:hypothetical protein
VRRVYRRKVELALALLFLILGLVAAYSYSQSFLFRTQESQNQTGAGLVQFVEEKSNSKSLKMSRETSSNEALNALIQNSNQLVKTVVRLANRIGKRFHAAEVIKHIKVISGQIGVREAGSQSEGQAADYIERVLTSYGYVVKRQMFNLPNGKSSENLVAVVPGQLDRVLILGAHYDSKPPSPGANDNASGVGVLLELARIYTLRQPTPTIKFVFFGAEEMIDKNPDHHHYGSRHYVASLRPLQKKKIFGMISVDMVGYGNNFHVRTMKRGPQSLAEKLLSVARQNNLNLTFRKDRGQYGWSDHEPFELAGIPAAWLEWRNDPLYHTSQDTWPHLNEDCIQTTGELILSLLSSLTTKEIESVHR